MKQTLKFTHISEGILRVRRSVSHGASIAERYGLLTLPQELSDSGIKVTGNKLILPNNRELTIRILSNANEEYTNLHNSLIHEFQDKYTNYEEIIGTPEKNTAEPEILPEAVASEDFFALEIDIHDSEHFYGLGEGANDRIELRGKAYQNWARYQYNEIPIPLCLSSEGWGIWINTNSRSFFDIGYRKHDKLITLGEDAELDIFILSGNSLRELISRYTSLTGKPMLLPKWAYGLSYIAPIHATQFDLLTQAERFRKEHIPCDMFSLEPGWMAKNYDYSTKKTWNEQRFHIPKYIKEDTAYMTFLGAMKRYGYRVSLWLCVRYDFTEEEERLLVDGNPDDYGEAWYEHLKKFTAIGVDGYKMDPADNLCCFDKMNRPRCYNGLTSMQMHNLNQVILPKQMYMGYSEQKNRRPMHHYSGGYSGIQHWSASTTGDNGGELGAMIWLETLALSGHMNTTIDMNIFFAESLHFGMLVPWAHLNAWSGVRQPWYAGDTQHIMFAEYARMRYRLIPYIYSAAIEGHEDSMPIVRPMPLAFPDDEATVSSTRQYMFGEYLLVTAYTDFVHLPRGEWMDAWTGEAYTGPCDIEHYKAPQRRGGGLFIKRGAIIPNWCDRDYVSQYSDQTIALDIYPCGNSSYIFREDDGISLDCNTQPSCQTRISVRDCDEKLTVNIGSREGDYSGKPVERIWNVRLHLSENDRPKPIEVTCAAGDRVSYEISENPVSLFNPDASDILA